LKDEDSSGTESPGGTATSKIARQHTDPKDLDYLAKGKAPKSPPCRWEDIILASELKKGKKVYSVKDEHVHDVSFPMNFHCSQLTLGRIE
jgi:hypothetical protein